MCLSLKKMLPADSEIWLNDSHVRLIIQATDSRRRFYDGN